MDITVLQRSLDKVQKYRRICMTRDEYDNHTFDTGKTIDEETSSFISVDSTYSKKTISLMLADENPRYITINGKNPEMLAENEVIMICRCNFRKWTKEYSCFARKDQLEDTEDDEEEDEFYDANEDIKAEEIWVYPRDELCRMVAQSKDFSLRIPTPDDVTLDEKQTLSLLQAVKIECEGREARKLMLREGNDAIQELVIRIVSKFLSSKLENTSTTISYYTPKFIKSLGKNLFSGTSKIIGWIWRHPFWCLYVSSATRCIRTMMCLWSNGIEWNLLKPIAYKMLERWAKPGTMFVEMCKSMINAFFCVASTIEKVLKGQVMSAGWQAISECFKDSVVLVGRVGEYIMAIVEYFGVEMSDRFGITDAYAWIVENLAPSKMTTMLELDKITRIIDKPKHVLVETVVLNIILKKPVMIMNMISMFTISIPAPAMIQSVIEISNIGKNTIKTLEEYSQKLAEVLIDGRQFQQAIQAFIEAIYDIVSYAICNIKTYYNYPNECCSDTSNLVKVLMNMQNPKDTTQNTWSEWWAGEGHERIDFNKSDDIRFLHFEPYKNALKDEL